MKKHTWIIFLVIAALLVPLGAIQAQDDDES